MFDIWFIVLFFVSIIGLISYFCYIVCDCYDIIDDCKKLQKEIRELRK